MLRTLYRLRKSDLQSRKRKILVGHYAYNKFTSEKAYKIRADFVLRNWKPSNAKN